MSWLVKIRSLDELPRHKANLRVTCLECRHFAEFGATAIIAYFRARRWSMAWELLHEHFRCTRCGRKRVRCDPVGAPDPPRPIAALRPRPRPLTEAVAPPELRVVGGKR